MKGMPSFLFFSLRIWSSQKFSLLTFPLFQVAVDWKRGKVGKLNFWLDHIVDWKVLKSSANSRLLIRGLHSTNYITVTWSRFDENSGLCSSLIDVLPERLVLNLVISYDNFVINTRNVFNCFCCLFVIRKLPF